MVVFPNAKINIGLDILSRRPDGYHNISTIMMPIGWQDILEITPSKQTTDTLHVTGRSVDCPPEKNLVMRAVNLLRTKKEFPAVDINLHKIIPSGAGVGGGSADAAFALTALNDMFQLGFTADNLEDIASTLGADCAFFVRNEPRYCTGIGNIFSSVKLNIPPELTIIVVKPPVEVSTAEAYSGVIPEIPEFPLNIIAQETPITLWQGRVKNDFETNVFKIYPQIAFVKQTLLDLGAIYASMSGSGASLYGFFNASDASEEVKAALPNCEIFSQKLEKQLFRL